MNFIRVVFNSFILIGLYVFLGLSQSFAANAAPTIATAPSATPSPAVGTTAALSVLGADDGGEPALIYTWATTGTPPAAVTFSVNGTNAAKNTTATFTKSGTYNFSVTIKDTGALTVVGNLVLVVNSTVTTITVTPAAALVNSGTTKQYTASAKNQFNTTMSPQPTFTWSVTGGGSISSSGLFTANTSTGTYTVQASAGGVNGTTTVQVNAAPTVATPAAAAANPVTGKTVVLTALGADDEGEPALVYTWATTGTPPAAVTFSPNGTNAAKSTTATFTKVGTYSLQVTIKDTHAATVISSLSVTVSPTFTSVSMNPVRATVLVGKTQTYVATGLDQFAAALVSQPPFTWATTGGGTVSSAGVYTATTSGGPFNVTATASSLTGTANATVAGNIVAVNGHITANTTFVKTSIYHVTSIWVDPGVTLTIQAGTIIKFLDGATLVVSDGTCNAVGVLLTEMNYERSR